MLFFRRLRALDVSFENEIIELETVHAIKPALLLDKQFEFSFNIRVKPP